MPVFRRKSSVRVVQPVNIFEQLEDRIVLDATIDPIDNQTLDQDETLSVDANAASGDPDEGDTGFQYSLFIDDGSGGSEVDVDKWNDNNDPAAADIAFDSITGLITWTPNNLDVLPGSGSYTFIVRSDDGMGDTGQETFLVTVNDLPPLIDTQDNTTFTEDAGVQTFDVNCDDEGKGITYSLIGPGVPSGVTIDPTTGVISADPDDTLVGFHTFTVRAADANDFYDQTFELTVENRMDFDTANNTSVMEDDALLYDVDTDTETYGITPVEYSLDGAPDWISIDPDTGVITGNPTNYDVEDSPYVFVIHADDGSEVVDQTFTLTVTNNPPHFLNVELDFYMTERSGIQTFDVQTDDEGDAPPSGMPGYTLVSLDGGSVPAWLSIDSDTGIISGTPVNANVGDYSLVVEFSDGNGGVEQLTLAVHVANIELFYTSDAATTWTEDVAGQTFNVETSEEGDGVTYSFAGGALTWGGWIAIDPLTGVLSALGVQPDNSLVGDHTFTIYADEGHGDAPIEQEFTLTIVNTPPVIVTSNGTAVEDSGVEVRIPVLLQEAEPGATWSLMYPPTLPSGGSVSIDSVTGEIIIPMPDNRDVGTYSVNVMVDDGNGGVMYQMVTFEITNAVPSWDWGSGPVLTDITVDQGDAVSYDFNADDEGQNPPTHSTSYSVTSGPSWLSIDSFGQLSGTPSNADVGDHTVTIEFDDANGGVITHSFTIHVMNVEPELTPDGPFIMTEDAGYYIFDIDSTEEGDGPVTYSLGSGAPSWLAAAFDTDTGSFSLVPLNEHVGSWTFDVTVSDGHGGTATETYTITVNNNAPLWDPDPSPGDYHVTIDIDQGAQYFDLHTTDENSDNNNEYRIDLSSVTLPSWLSISVDSSTGILTIDPTGGGPDPRVETTLSFPVRFFDGTEWIEENLVITITDIPPGDTEDHDDYFFSMNHTRFLEDETNQHFDIQYTGEDGGATVTYSFDTSDANVSADGLTYGGWLTINASTGVLTGSPINSQVTSPIDGNAYQFDIIVWQGGVEIARQADFELHVDNVNPVFTTPEQSVIITEDTTPKDVTLVDINTTDEGHGSETSYSIIDGTDEVPDWIQIAEDTGAISITRTLDNDETQGTWNLQVQFDDGHGGVITQALTVTLANRFNFTSANSGVWGEDSSGFTFDVNTDDDVHTGDVTYWLEDVPAWLVGNIDIDSSTGVITTDAGFEPDNTLVGTHTFTVHATDTHGEITQTFYLRIYNRDPVFDTDVVYTDLRMYEDDGEDVINLHVDDEGLGTTYYTMSGAPSWMYIDPDTGEIHGDPTNAQVGSYTFTVTAWDQNQAYTYGQSGIDGKTEQVVTVNVYNRDPVFSSADATTVYEDHALSFNVQTDDESVGGTKYQLVGNDSWIKINTDTGVITANPTNAHVGTHTFIVRVNDQHSGVVDQTFTLTVENVAPTFLNPQSTTYSLTLTEDTTGNYFDLLTDDDFQHNPYADGGDGSEVIYSIDTATAPPGLRFADDGGNGFDADEYGYTKSYSGKLTINPTNRDVGTFIVPITIDDGNGGVTTLNFTLTVVNTTPRFTTPNKAIWYEDVTTQYPFNVYTTDEPHDHWLGPPFHDENVYTLIGAPSWLIIDSKNGTMSVNPVDTQNLDGSPDNHLVGEYTFIIDFYDGDVHIQQPFTLTIENTPTLIDLVPPDPTVTQDSLWEVTDVEVNATDEYANMVGYDQDYYELYIQFENQGEWYRVDNGEYNTINDAWNGADIYFDPETGAISWTPNNADVPNSLDGDGELRHQFQIIHYDGWGTQDDEYFFLYVTNLPPTLPALQDWELREDTAWGRVGGTSGTEYADATYPESLVQSSEEGVGVTYSLWVDGVAVDQTDPLGDPDYVALQVNGPEGGWLRFNIYTGEIEWDTTNADVTVLEGDSTQLRSPYVFSIQADDGNLTADPAGANLSPIQQFNVTVYNAPTDITSVPAGGNITEDSDFTYDIEATDEEAERDAGDTYYQDTYYTLEINDGSVTDGDADPDWVDWTYYNANNGALRADITFDEDTGEFAWDPNHSDTLHVGDYEFRVTHYDGHGSSDTETFVYTVVNNPADVLEPVQWDLTEDDAVNHPGDTTLWTLDLDTSDDAHTAVTFELRIDGVAWTSGYQPNGPNGGEITFESATGVITWETTNEDVGTYSFEVRANDGYGWSDWADGEFSVVVANTATDITTVVPDQPLEEDTGVLELTDTDVQAIDEYPDETGYPADDYYEFYILWENQDTSTWIRIDNGDFNDANNAWGGADFSWDTKTGALTWANPNNADVPNTPDSDGLYRHQIQIVHYDGHGTSDTDEFYVSFTNVTPTLDSLPDWELTEDTAWSKVLDPPVTGTEYSNWIYPENFVNSDEEGYGVTYLLQISLDGGTTWQDWDSFTGAWTGSRPNGADGGVITFDASNGEILWETTNADVTIMEDDVTESRSPYIFRVQADDGNPTDNLSTWEQFQVIVYNNETDITDHPADQNISEDVTFTYDIEATDEEVERSDPGIDTYYTLEVFEGGSWVIYTNGVDGYNEINGDKADVIFDTDTGEFEWTPNHDDAEVGSRDFRVTHYDANGSYDQEEFTLTVDNRTPVINLPPGDLWELTEDETDADGDDVTYTFTSDDDTPTAYTNVTYEVQIYADLDADGTWQWETITSGGIQPNGPDGGLLVYDNATDTVKWETTNADSTLATPTDGGAQTAPVYDFRVRANDGLDTSDWSAFTVQVHNDPTVIENPLAATQSVSQNSNFLYDFTARDEEQERPTTHDDFDNTYYTLEVSTDGGTTWITYSNGVDGYNESNGLRADVTFNGDTGEFDWTPNNLDSVAGSLDFRVTHYDGNDSSDQHVFEITVDNVAPIVDPLPDWELTEDTAWSKVLDPLPAGTEFSDSIYPETYVDSDEEGYGVTYDLEISLDGGTTFYDWDSFTGTWSGSRPNGEDGGVITFNTTTGEIDWVTTNADVTEGVPGRSPYVFRIQADDGAALNNLSGWDEFNVIVYNDPTVITDSPPDQHITEDSTFTYDIEATDEEVERPDPAAIDTYYTLEVFEGGSWVIYTNGVDGYNEINGDKADVIFDTDTGEFEWTPNQDDAEVGSRDFKVTHYDANGSYDEEEFTLTVDNRTPVINLPPGDVWELTEDETDADGDDVTYTFTSDDDTPTAYTNVTYEVQIYADLDADGTWQWETITSGGIQPNGPDGGLLVYDNATDTVKWETTNADSTLATPTDGGAQTAPVYDFRVRANDGLDTGDWSAFTVQVHNDPTVIDNPLPATQEVTEDSTFTHDFNATDEEQERPTGHDDFDNTYYTLEVSTDGGTTWITYSNGVDGYNETNALRADVTFDTDTGEFEWTPNQDDAEVGSLNFRVTHYDGNDSSDQHLFEITVPNRTPVINLPPGDLWELTEDETDADGDDVTYTFTSDDDTPTAYTNVTYEVQIYADLDADGTWQWETITSGGIQPNGPDGGLLVYDDATDTVKWETTNADSTLATPTDGGAQTAPVYDFRVRANDGLDTGDWSAFTVQVHNDPTVIDNPLPATQEVTEDSTFTHDFNATDEEQERPTGHDDFDNTYYTLEVSTDGGTTWITYSNGVDGYNETNALRADVTFDTDTGEFEWTPNQDDAEVGSLDFRVTHYDGNDSSDQHLFEITVPNRTPVINLPPGDLWELTEDETDADGDDVTYTFTSDDDTPTAYTNVTYEVQIYADLDADGTWQWETITSGGIQPNGPDGGLLVYDDATDTVKWETTNADSTLATPTDGGAQTAPVYDFRVRANDGLDTGDWSAFTVQVHNDPTVIDNPLPATQEVTEDSTFTHDFNATDEEQERPTGHDDFDNTYYTLEVSTDGGTTWITYSNGVDGYNETNALRADVTFDTDTGEFEWTANNLDSLAGSLDFRITHYDGNDSSDQHLFTLTVANVAPSLDLLPMWELLEDNAWSNVDGPLPGGTDYTDAIYPETYVDSNDEGYGASYSLQVSLDGVNWYDWDSFTDASWSGSRPNGGDGGELVFYPTTGEIRWETTNADVTDGVPGRSPYMFRIQADDGNGVDNLSSWQQFDVIVYNNPTDITDHPADQEVSEDVLFQYDIQATDEEVERSGLDTYYELNVNDGTGWVSFTVYNSDNGSRGDIVFNTDTGAFEWTPNNLDKLVGTYDFEVIHHDGHGSADNETFQLTLHNDPPTFTASPVEWSLREDDAVNNSGTPGLWTLDESQIETTDEGLGLTYSLYIDGTLWESGYHPNGPDGGEIFFNTDTGEIVWATTNADVTTFWGGGEARSAYEFRIVADDNAGGVAQIYFDVTVADDATNINDIPDQTIVEDGSPLSIDAVSRDEQVESNNPVPDELGTGDAYYTLEIDRHDASGASTGFVDVSTYNTKNDTLGTDIVFNASTGQINWDAANPDVGEYTFRITHHDGFNNSASDTFNVTVENEGPHFTTNPPADPVVVMETKYLTYDAGSTDEEQHDWRADDWVTYSIVEGPGDISIDQYTGLIYWEAPSELAGTHTVTIRVDDGNGGWDIQSFRLIIDVPVQPVFTETPVPVDVPDPIDPPSGFEVHEPILALQKPVDSEPEPEWSQFLKHPTETISNVFSQILGKIFRQPEQKIGGSTAPITPLEGYSPQVLGGKRLDFDADVISVWDKLDLQQPSLGIGGSQDPTTPLEGYPGPVEMGKQLDFDYFPIQETVSFDLDDLTVAQLLEID